MDRQQQQLDQFQAQNEVAETNEVAFQFLNDTQLILVGGGIGDTVL
jgi:hypothetical protein